MVNTEIKLIIFFVAKDGEGLYNKQKQDLELTVVQIISSLLQNPGSREVGKTIRPFRYDLNHIPYDYTAEVTNRFKGLDLIESLKNYGKRFITLYRRWWPKPCNYPQEKDMQESKMVVWRGLTNSWKKKRSERQRRKRKIYQTECRVPEKGKKT